ncbi:hypothetical protein GCM10010343_05520 [Streptomyces avidinii]|nr:hypothetical protein GCM10010343_05520 [Streptomyces avidinii]
MPRAVRQGQHRPGDRPASGRQEVRDLQLPSPAQASGRAGSAASAQRTVTRVSHSAMGPIISDMRPSRIGIPAGG